MQRTFILFLIGYRLSEILQPLTVKFSMQVEINERKEGEEDEEKEKTFHPQQNQFRLK